MTHPVKPKKTFAQRLWDVVFTLFYPILVLFSLLFVGAVYLFSALSWLISWLLPRRKESSASESPTPVWEPWVTASNLSIERIFVDEIMFGPSYYRLRTLPSSEAVSAHYFGDFYHLCFGGVLLQKWNTTVPKELPDFDLLFFNGETGRLHHLKTIKATDWQVEETPEAVTLRWPEGDQSGTLTLTEDLVLPDAQPLD